MRKIIFLLAAIMYSLLTLNAQTLINVEAENKIASGEYASVIQEKVKEVTEESFVECSLLYRIPKDEKEALKSVLYNRELRKEYYNYIYANSITDRVKAKKEIDAIYEDSINTILIPYNDGITGNNLRLALRLAKVMDVKPSNYQNMMESALEMSHALKADPKKDVWTDELEILKRNFNEDEMETFFAQKNAERITKAIRVAWMRLEEAGLTEQLDSVEDCSKAYKYYYEYYRISDLYHNKGASKKRYLNELKKYQPLMIKLINGLDQQMQANKNEEKNQQIGKDFIW